MEFPSSFEKVKEKEAKVGNESKEKVRPDAIPQQIVGNHMHRGRGRGRGRGKNTYLLKVPSERNWSEFVKPKHHRADEHVGRLPWLPPRKPFFWKTTMCLDLDKNCRFGKHCRYAHSEEELRPKPDDSDPLVKHIMVLENEIEEYKKELGRVRSELNRIRSNGYHGGLAGNGFHGRSNFGGMNRARGSGKTMIIREIIREVPVEDYYSQWDELRGGTPGRVRHATPNHNSEYTDSFRPY